MALTDVPDPERPGSTVRGQAFASVWRCERSDLVAARRSASLFRRGRIELYFRDRSLCAVMTGAMSAEPAERLLGALALPSVPPPA